MKKLSLLLVFIILLTFVAGCGNSEKVVTPSKVKEINISYVKLPLNVPSIVEKKLALFEKEFERDGIKVTFPEILEGPKMTEALASGSLDFCNALGATSAIMAAANGVDLKIIGMYSRAPKAFTIMAKNEQISTIKDLKGKKIAGPKGTILHQLLIAALAKEGMKASDIEFLNMSIPNGVAAMFSNNVDAVLVAGPAVLKATENGARIITTGEGLVDASIVIAGSGKFIKEQDTLVKRYLKVHNESIKYMADNTEAVYKMAAEETGLSIDDVKKMYSWYNFNPEITAQDIAELDKTQEFLIKNEMLNKKIDIKSIIHK